MKQEVFRKIDVFAKPGAILASNTSYLDIDAIAAIAAIAAATARPQDVLGLHFFSPANVMKLLEDGAWPEDVDNALTGMGFAMGPFAVADLSGLDIAWRMRKTQAATRDSRERYVSILDQLCEQGRLGRKTGAGYYTYTDGSH